MKVFKQYIATLIAVCVLAVGAMAFEPQKDKDQKPPPKPPQEVPNREKPPPPPKNDNNNRGNDGRKKP